MIEWLDLYLPSINLWNLPLYFKNNEDLFLEDSDEAF